MNRKINNADEGLALTANLEKHWQGSDMDIVIAPMIDDLKPIVDANHRKAIGALLRQGEERWIRKNKLETFWEPTPFPVEFA